MVKKNVKVRAHVRKINGKNVHVKLHTRVIDKKLTSKRPSKATPNDVRKMLETFKADMISNISGDYTVNAKKISEKYEIRTDELFKQLESYFPIWNNIMKKRRDADRGMYFAKIDYTPKEIEFMKNNSQLLKINSLNNVMYKKLEEEKLSFKRRILKNKMTPDEQEIHDNASITIWNTSNDYLKGSDIEHYGNKYPMITLDSNYYDALNDEDGFYSGKWEIRFDYMLKKIGCYAEPYHKSDRMIYCDDFKPSAIDFKEDYLKENDYAKEHIRDLK